MNRYFKILSRIANSRPMWIIYFVAFLCAELVIGLTIAEAVKWL